MLIGFDIPANSPEVANLMNEIGRSAALAANGLAAKVKTGFLTPGDFVPAILPAKGGRIEATVMRWGIKYPNRDAMIGARFEGIRRRPGLKDLIDRRRCVVPVGALVYAAGPERSRYIAAPEGGGVVFAPGIYDVFRNRVTGADEGCFAFLTKPAPRYLLPLTPLVPLAFGKRNILFWFGSKEVDELFYADFPRYTVRPL